MTELILSAVGGSLVTGVFALFTHTENTALEREKLALQNRIAALEREAKANLQRDQLAHDTELEKIRIQGARLNHVLDAAREHKRQLALLEASPTGPTWQIGVRNSCDKPIFAAINYQALDGQWAVDGWWRVEPGDRRVLAPRTRNRVYYIYAEANQKWAGAAESGGSTHPVRNEVFHYLSDDPPPWLEGVRSVTFHERRFEATESSPTAQFACEVVEKEGTHSGK